MAQQGFMSRKLEHIWTALHEQSPLATVLQTLVASYLDGPTTLLVTDIDNHVIRAVCLEDGSVRTIAGQPKKSGHLDGKPALFNEPYALAVHKPSNTLFVAERLCQCIRRVSLDDFTVSTFCGRPRKRGYKEGAGSAALFTGIRGLAILGSDLIVSDAANHCIRRVPLDGGASSLVAGSPRQHGFVDGRGSEAKFKWPWGITADSAGNVFVADYGNHRIRKIDLSGVVSTVAGCRLYGHKDGFAEEAQFCRPQGLAFDSERKLLVCDYEDGCVRRVNLEVGTVTTVAGQRGQLDHVDGPANEAKFDYPDQIVVNPTTGDTYVSCENRTIRKVSKEGVVSTFCGRPDVGGFGPCGLALV